MTFRWVGSGDGQEQATLPKGWECRQQDRSHPGRGVMLFRFCAGKGGRYGRVPLILAQWYVLYLNDLGASKAGRLWRLAYAENRNLCHTVSRVALQSNVLDLLC